MSFLNYGNIFWEIIVFLYFSCKSWFLSRIFRDSQIRTHFLVSLTITAAALLINSQIQAEYARYLDMSYVKGAIRLPPFTLLFILADFISTVVLLLLITARAGTSFFKLPVTRILMDILRLVMIYVIFILIVSRLWVKEVDRNLNWNFECFKSQMAIDIAVFYYQNGRLPNRLDEFSQFTTNPINNSDLVFTDGSTLSIYISDQMGNKIIEGYKDLIGLDTDPLSFFTVYRIFNKTLCSGGLKIPSEYNQDPSWQK